MPAYDVFLSYSRSDRDFVQQLAQDLMRAGLKVWFDLWNLRPGDTIAFALEEGLRESRFLLVVMSPDYFQSAWTQQEWQSALVSEMEGRHVGLIPILYRDCEVPLGLRMKQWADFRDPDNYQTSLNLLLRDLSVLAVSDSPKSPTIDSPKAGEPVGEIDAAILAELKSALQDAVDAFRKGPPADPPVSAVAELTKIDENTCFVIMPFSVDSLNIVYEDFVKPILEDRCKLNSQRGDDVFGSNVIMDDVTRCIRKAHLIIADLTGRNPNVFYEVGIAHALNKNVLLMTQSIEDVPFDLRHRRALVYEYSPRGCKKLEKDLYSHVLNMLEPQKS